MAKRIAFVSILVVFGFSSLWPQVDSVGRFTLLAFGDINIGRSVGQELLKGDVDFPFVYLAQILSQEDAVFANLESPITDQRGQTEDPKHNVVFCGPPVGALSLRRAHVSVVSTANNHAFDYNLKGLKQTVRFLCDADVQHTGISGERVETFPPAVVERHGIRVGFLAYTQFVNIAGDWRGRISLFDSARARKEIASLRQHADVVIASYHGGKEYADAPDEKTLREMRALVDAGADVVLGHHPHVPQGIEEYHGKLIAYSLGNFVFYQPQLSWTQRAFGLKLQFEKKRSTASLVGVQLVPFRSGKQPRMDLSDSEVCALVDRVKALSTASITQVEQTYYIQLHSLTSRD